MLRDVCCEKCKMCGSERSILRMCVCILALFLTKCSAAVFLQWRSVSSDVVSDSTVVCIFFLK